MAKRVKTRSEECKKAISEGMKGNQNGLALKDSDIRQQAYGQYCEWLAKGKMSRSFTFEHEQYSCTGETMESYIKNNPSEFSSIKKQIAFSKGLAHWEEIVDGSATGDNEAPTASLQMVMRNKYGWDKEDKNSQSQASTQLAHYICAQLGFKRADESTDIQPQAD